MKYKPYLLNAVRVIPSHLFHLCEKSPMMYECWCGAKLVSTVRGIIMIINTYPYDSSVMQIKALVLITFDQRWHLPCDMRF